MSTYLCLDLGGTGLKAGLVRDGVLLEKKVTPTKTEHRLESIQETYRDALALFPPESYDAVAVSSAGRINSDLGRVEYATEILPGYTGFALTDYLTAQTGKPCAALNDGHAAALGEYAALGEPERTMLMITVGTGIGGAYVEGGRIAPFPPDRDLGHLYYGDNGVTCSCGRTGCIETYISGTALHRRLSQAGAEKESNEALWRAYKGREADVTAVIDAWYADLVGILDALWHTRPYDVAVLGGGLAAAKDAWFRSRAFVSKPYRVKISSSGNDAGMLGAFAFAKEKLGI